MAFEMEVKEQKQGIFTISLDFELHWGVSDHRTIESYRENLEQTPEVVNRLLALFSNHGIHATWATVGLLFGRNKMDIDRVKRENQPQYEHKTYSNYRLFPETGADEEEDPFHFAPSLIQKINETKFQEVSTHTFSHYYCLEKGQTIENFVADLDAAVEIAGDEISIETIIFPRNQYANEHIKACADAGIIAYRGNETHWIYRPRSRADETQIRRGFRLLDSYINISGEHIYDLNRIKQNRPYNIPASRFLRPYSRKLKPLEWLRLRRIKSEMTKAAKLRKLYHLWWHPHNFGANLEENFTFLKEILKHFKMLSDKYGMVSLNMVEIAKKMDNER